MPPSQPALVVLDTVEVILGVLVVGPGLELATVNHVLKTVLLILIIVIVIKLLTEPFNGLSHLKPGPALASM